jgi:hypothetical protein
LNVFGLNKKSAEKILTVECGIIGFNLRSDLGKKFLDEWKQAALNGGFYSSRSEQNAFSIIAYLNNMNNWDSETRADGIDSISSNSLFCYDRLFSPIPESR